LLVFSLAAGDRQFVLLSCNCDLIGCKPRERQGNTISVLPCPNNIVRGIIVLGIELLGIVDEIEEAIEADAGPP
jgi:hypothetical protein